MSEVTKLRIVPARRLEKELAAERAAERASERRVPLPQAVVEAFRCRHCVSDPPIIPRVIVRHEDGCPTLRRS
jgi:hypothetical protein